MKGFIAGLAAGVVLGGGAIVAAGLPNPAVGECEWADLIERRGDPTYLDPEGPVTGGRIWQVCSYQVPTGVGSNMRAVDEQFWTDIDLDDAEWIHEATGDMLASGGDVFMGDTP